MAVDYPPPASARAEPTPAFANAGRIRSNLVWMVTGNVWSGFCQWVLLVILAKLGNVDMVGTFTLGLAIALPVLMFSCLNLRALYVTDCSYTYRFREYLALRLLMAVGSVIFIVAFAVIAGYSRGLLVPITLISIARALDYVSDILYGLLQRQERMTAMSVSMILRGTLSVCGLSAGLYLTGSLVWGAAGLVLASALTLLAFDIPVSLAESNIRVAAAWKECAAWVATLFAQNRPGYRRLKSLAFSGVPLGLVVMLVSLNINIPRYFVERSLGMREQGIFSSLANLIAAGTVVMGALGQSATPRLAKHFAAGEMRAFKTLLWLMVLASVGFGAAGLAGALAFGRQALSLIYRPEYAARQDVFIWLMAASGFLYLANTMGVALTAARCLNPQLPLFAIAAATTALTCSFLVPAMGLRGAAAAILISAVVQCAGGIYLLAHTCSRAGRVAISG